MEFITVFILSILWFKINLEGHQSQANVIVPILPCHVSIIIIIIINS